MLLGLGDIGVGYDLAEAPQGGAVGCSNASIRTHAAAVDADRRFHLLGGVDPSAERPSRLERVYSVPAWSSISSTDADLEPDVVVVASQLSPAEWCTDPGERVALM